MMEDFVSSDQQEFYASAMCNLDWLTATSYNPVQLIDKYQLPMLVRITEGHYGNMENNCFSAAETIKLHEIQHVDMIIAKIGTDSSGKDLDAPVPMRVCFPKNFTGRFDTHHEGCLGSELQKVIKTVRKLAEVAPHFVEVVKRPCKKDEVVLSIGEVLEVMGLSSCSNWTDEKGFLRCRKMDGEFIFLNLAWRGVFRAVTDPEGFTLRDILDRFMLPIKVILRNPESCLPPEFELIQLLAESTAPMLLERETTYEFLVGTTANNLENSPSTSSSSDSSRSLSANRTSIVILTKNANVHFEICRDMIHRKAVYQSLMNVFGGCNIDRIQPESFVCEYAAPFVTFIQTELTMPPSTFGDTSGCGAQKQRSMSDPELRMGTETETPTKDRDNVDGYVSYVSVQRTERRPLPELPIEAHGTVTVKWINTAPRPLLASSVINQAPTLTAYGTKNHQVNEYEDSGHYANPVTLGIGLPILHPEACRPCPEPPLPPPSDFTTPAPSEKPPPPLPPPRNPKPTRDVHSANSSQPTPLQVSLKAESWKLGDRIGTKYQASVRKPVPVPPADRPADGCAFRSLPSRTKLFREAQRENRSSSSSFDTYLKPLPVPPTDKSRGSPNTSLHRSLSSQALLEKNTSASAQSRSSTPKEQPHKVSSLRDIPSDLGTLTTSELAQCLRLLNFDEVLLRRFRDYQINGSLLLRISSQSVRNDLTLTDFEADKLEAFRKGWRPDEEP